MNYIILSLFLINYNSIDVVDADKQISRTSANCDFAIYDFYLYIVIIHI